MQCTVDRPFSCPGFPSVCAVSGDACPSPSARSCGGTQSLCANGQCSSECQPANEYFADTTFAGSALQISSCASQGLVQCPNFECRQSYTECSDVLYCPLPANYTYSPSALICPGVQTCALSRAECSYSQCQSTLNW